MKDKEKEEIFMEVISKRIENKEFFSCSSPKVAADLLGKLLCRKKEDGTIVRLRITVTEAYEDQDTACYGIGYVEGEYKNKRKTAANAPLFETGGVWCIYGGMLLLLCGQKDIPENVLIREAGNEEQYCNGPINLCEYLEINSATHHGKNVISSDSLCIDDRATRSYYATQ